MKSECKEQQEFLQAKVRAVRAEFPVHKCNMAVTEVLWGALVSNPSQAMWRDLKILVGHATSRDLQKIGSVALWRVHDYFYNSCNL